MWLKIPQIKNNISQNSKYTVVNIQKIQNVLHIVLFLPITMVGLKNNDPSADSSTGENMAAEITLCRTSLMRT